jgi:hypothetical protein
MKVYPAGGAATLQTTLESLGGSQGPINQGWSDIVSRLGNYIHNGARSGLSPSGQIDHLSGLIKLQVDVSRYQLRVELVSKVSESAVASMRKLQQNQ